jgi:hypothetical protein
LHELLKAGNAEAVSAVARTLRERLGEAASELGVLANVCSVHEG